MARLYPVPHSHRSRAHRARLHPISYKENPAWLAKALAENITGIQTQVQPAWLPKIEEASPRNEGVLVDFQEYGCGAYGCVLPTHDPQVVLKVTTDSSEAGFVQHAMQWPWPEGITTYHALMELDGLYRVTTRMKRGQPAWVLWRQSAVHVGDLGTELGAGWGAFSAYPQHSLDDREEALHLVDAVYAAGARALLLLLNESRQGGDPGAAYEEARSARQVAGEVLREEGRPPDGEVWMDRLIDVAETGDVSLPLELAIFIEAYRQTATYMASTEILGAVGKTLLFYLSKQILLADLHGGNFGLVHRGGERWVWAITDPGNVMVLPQAWV